MRCYECATKSRETEAVAVCTECGRGLCMEHAGIVRVPQFFELPMGMARVTRRCSLDRPRVLCQECREALDCCEARSQG
jgi:hypothetical protein